MTNASGQPQHAVTTTTTTGGMRPEPAPVPDGSFPPSCR